MTASVTDLDADRRHFAEFLLTDVLAYVKHRYAAWAFEGEAPEDVYHWVRTEGNAKFRQLDIAAILRHLTGIKTGRGRFSGLGVPILFDANIAGIGVLDIDTHTTGLVVDVAAIAAIADPAIVVTRSSSGRGAHLYVFPPVPVNSHVLRVALERYAASLLGQGVIPAEATVDIFPKSHGATTGEPAERIVSGGSVRFPFAGRRRPGFAVHDPAWSPPCEHFGEIFWGGEWVTNNVDRQRIIQTAQASHLMWLATWGGPGCLGRILTEGADEGERNILIYNAAYFAAFVTGDEAVATAWVNEHILPRLRGPEIPSRESQRTIRSGIEHAQDPAQAQYVCTTRLCSNEGRCGRLGQMSGSGVRVGATARALAATELTHAAATAAIDGGPNAISSRDGKVYIGADALMVEYCPIDERYYFTVDSRRQSFTPVSLVSGTTVGLLSTLLQREILVPKNAVRGWVTRLSMLARQEAAIFRHPVYSQLKAILYAITKREGESVPAAVVHDAFKGGIRRQDTAIDNAMRYYPGRDWRPVLSTENEVLGMRLYVPDYDFLTVVAPPMAEPPSMDY